jgi:hypothetical protein
MRHANLRQIWHAFLIDVAEYRAKWQLYVSRDFIRGLIDPVKHNVAIWHNIWRHQLKMHAKYNINWHARIFLPFGMSLVCHLKWHFVSGECCDKVSIHGKLLGLFVTSKGLKEEVSVLNCVAGKRPSP